MKKILYINLSIIILGFMTSNLLSQVSIVPTMINYQGFLTDQNGTALTGSYEITFRLYDEESGNHPWLWSEIHDSVTVENGLFNVLLGSISTLTAEDVGGVRFLAIKLAEEIEMKPRMQLASVAYALQSERMEPDYDSGWFEVGTRQTHALNLGFTLTDLPMSIQIYYSDNANPQMGTDEIWQIQSGQYYYSGGGMGAYVEIQDASTIKIHTGWHYIIHAYTSGSETSPYSARETTGYYRVRVWQ